MGKEGENDESPPAVMSLKNADSAETEPTERENTLEPGKTHPELRTSREILLSFYERQGCAQFARTSLTSSRARY